MAKTVLVINSGSSSIKYQLVDLESGEGIASGLVEKIGEPVDGHYKHEYNGEKHELEEPIHDHEQGLKRVLGFFDEYGPKLADAGIVAVGHRVVHGGENFKGSALVTEKVIEEIDELSKLAPLHNPAAVLGLRAVQKALPNVPQVVAFDTAFHQTMPKEAFLYGLPLEQYTEHKIRRYGAHGTSHQFVAEECAKLIGKKGKIITCHLGNGASISAVEGGLCKDTSMGFTPLAGVIMGTRCGDIDPYIPLHIMKYQNKTVDEVNTLLNKQSGMLGLSGFSDMRDVEAKYLEGDAKAIDALKTYAYTLVKFIGSYIAVLGGVDAIVFTAGIGENSPIVRKMVLERLSYLGIELDEENNNKRGDAVEITKPGSKVRAFVIPTNEELVIAQDTVRLSR